MNRHRRPFSEQRDPNQVPIHQYPGSDFERRNPDEYQPRMNVPVSGILKSNGLSLGGIKRDSSNLRSSVALRVTIVVSNVAHWTECQACHRKTAC